MPDVTGGPDIVAVRRTGGFAGIVAEGQVDLASSPNGGELADLLERIDLDAIKASAPQPDRFVYHLSTGDRTVTIAEQDLTADLQRVMDLVLGR